MRVSVTLRGRTCFAALLHQVEQQVDQRGEWPRLDRRSQRTRRQMLVGVLVQRSTRLLALGRFVAPQRRAGTARLCSNSATSARGR